MVSGGDDAPGVFFWRKSPLAAATAMATGWDNKKMLKSFLAAVLLSATVERCFVSRMRDFFFLNNLSTISDFLKRKKNDF